MTVYLSGAAIIADARLRLDALPPDQGILIVEGHDDVRVFAPHCIGGESVLPCGNKKKLLDAYARLRPGEEARLVFVADCDYDVPANRLTGQHNLILTERVDIEADLISLGLFRRVVHEIVPSASGSDVQCAAIATAVIGRAGALAEAIGKFRLVSTCDDLGLRFDGIVYRRYRAKGGSVVDFAKLGHALHKTSPNCGVTPDELIARAKSVAGDPKLRNGKDTIEIAKIVLHEDFGIKKAEVANLAVLIRLALSGDTATMARWSVVRRLANWQTSVGRVVLQRAVADG
jgi:hypothetical protein